MGEVVAVGSNKIQVGSDYSPNEVKQAVINISTAGDNLIVPLVSNKKIRVVARWYRANGSVILTPKSGLTDAIGAPDTLDTGYGISDCWAPYGYFYETAVGEPLVFNLSAGIQISGELNYIEI